jgi:hypothetical protein
MSLNRGDRLSFIYKKASRNENANIFFFFKIKITENELPKANFTEKFTPTLPKAKLV